MPVGIPGGGPSTMLGPPYAAIGAGSPEGVVTATVGARYVDTATGEEWIKLSGSGNTGWQRQPLLTLADAFSVDGTVIVSDAAANPDQKIRRNSDQGFIRLMGGDSINNSGQVRVFGRAFASAYDVDIRTPTAGAVETHRMGFTGGVDYGTCAVRNCNVDVLLNDAPTVQRMLVQSNLTITGSPDGTPSHSAFWANCSFQGTDGVNAREVKIVGIRSTVNLGTNPGTAAKGTAWCYGATMAVNKVGDDEAEPCCYFGSMSYLNQSSARAWFTDYTLLGPTGGATQMNLAGGVTMVINNYFNGAMASQGNTACFNAVTRKGQGAGGNVGEYFGQDTYAVDFGFLATGWAGSSGAKTAGFTVAFMAGGSGGMWNAALDGNGVPDPNAVSVLGTAFEGRDVTTWGLRLHTPSGAGASAIGVTAGTWVKGIDLTGAIFSSHVIHTGVGLHQFGGHTAWGQTPTTDRIIDVRMSHVGTQTTKYGITNRPSFNSSTTASGIGLFVRGDTDAAAFTITNMYTLYIADSQKGAGSAISNQVGLFVESITQGDTSNIAIDTHGGVVRFGDRVGIGVNVAASVALQVQNGLNMALTGTTQRGILVDFVSTSAATNATRGLETRAQTAAAAYTCASVEGIFVNDAILGAGSTITTQYGLRILSQTQGATNYAIHTSAGIVRFGDFIEGPEIADPAAPAANNGRLYWRDNGAGKTQLVARFPTGAVQVIATEP